MAQQSLYELLGIEPTATPDEIKAAYRRKAMEHHPDRNLGDEAAVEAFKAVQNAYEILSDPVKRAEYDATGSVENGPDINVVAQDILAQMVLNICNSLTEGGNPNSAIHLGRTDPFAILAGQLREQARGIERAAQMNTIQTARLQQILNRITSRTQPVTDTPVYQAISQQITTLKAREHSLQRDRELTQKLIELGAQYGYLTDTDTAAMRPPQATTGTLNLPHGR